MTEQGNQNPSGNLSGGNVANNVASKGVLPGQEGVILQRGGEELRLRKVGDRLTLCLSDPQALQPLNNHWQPQRVTHITPLVSSQSPVIVEWQIGAERLDDALTQLRDMPAVLYASHVYELEASPGTYVYLANQLTVQFTHQLTITQIEAIAQSLGLIRSHALTGSGNTR
jgi:hypothetical protein